MKLKEMIEIKKAEPDVTKEHLDKLDLATQSIGHRMDYCHYHYGEIKEITDKKSLMLDRILQFKEDTASIRIIYEANIVAFIQNLHALIDSMPYALNLFITVQTKIECSRIGWKPEFLKKYSEYPFYDSLNLMQEDQTFVKIKALTNTMKHKHLIRIGNDFRFLYFENFEYKHNEETKTQQSQNVKEFLVHCHDYLIPKYIELWDEIIEYKKNP